MPYYPDIVEEFGNINTPGSSNTIQFSASTVTGDSVSWGTIPLSVSYAISGTDATAFNIVENTGAITWAITPDPEKTYVFVVEGTNNEGNTTYQPVVLSTYSYNVGQTTGIYVFYEIGVEGSVINFPEEWIDPTIVPPPAYYEAHTARLKDYVGGVFNLESKIPNTYTNGTKYDILDVYQYDLNQLEFMYNDEFIGVKFFPDTYITPKDRQVAYGEDLSGVDELGTGRWLDVRLDCIGIDIDGRPDWYSQVDDYYTFQATTNGTGNPKSWPAVTGKKPELLNIIKNETITVTFTNFSPNILEGAIEIDNDLIIQLIKKDSTGTVIQTLTCDKNNLTQISMTATYPETVTIHVEGNYTRYMFPNEEWEYYFYKEEPYTVIPEHLPIALETEFDRTFDSANPPDVAGVIAEQESYTVGAETGNEITIPYFSDTKIEELQTSADDLRVLPEDPNETYATFRINQANTSQPKVNGKVLDLSQELPDEGNIVRYRQETTLERDATYTFTVTSSIPAWSSLPEYKGAWSVSGTYQLNDYVESGGNLYRIVAFGGTQPNQPPTGTTNFRGTVISPNVGPVPAGPVYRYIPDPMGTSFGAATIILRQNVLNNYIGGQERYQEVIENRPLRREPKPNTLEEPPRTDGF